MGRWAKYLPSSQKVTQQATPVVSTQKQQMAAPQLATTTQQPPTETGWQMPGLALAEQAAQPQTFPSISEEEARRQIEEVAKESPFALPLDVFTTPTGEIKEQLSPEEKDFYEQWEASGFQEIPIKAEAVEFIPPKISAQVLWQSLQYVPSEVKGKFFQAVNGIGGASVVNKDQDIATASAELDQFIQDVSTRYSSKTLQELAGTSRNVAYSIVSMGAGAAAGLPIALIPAPGARVAAWSIGTAASGYAAYRMASYEIMQTYLEFKDAEKRAQTGQGITLDEENKLKADFNDKAVKYGLWEAIPEALSNLAFAKILTAPLTKIVGAGMADKIITQIALTYGEELLTETITQKGQSDIEVEAGLREGRITLLEAFKEIAPQTFILTTLMAGTGEIAVNTPAAITKITNSLREEIGGTHALFNEIRQGLHNLAIDETGGIRLRRGEPAVGPVAGIEQGFMADLQDADTVAKVAFQPDVLRKTTSKMPAVRDLFQHIAPNVVAESPEAKYVVIRSTLMDEGGQKKQGVMAHLHELGSQEKVFGKQDENFVIKAGSLKGTTVGDIALQRGRWKGKLTSEQELWLDRANKIEQARTKYLRDHDIEVKDFPIEEGGQFATARVYARTLPDGTVQTTYVGAGGVRPGTRIPTEKHRTFRTDAQALEAGYHRLPYEEALGLSIQGAYNRVANKKAADWLLTQVDWRTTGAPEELVLAAESARLKMRHSEMFLAALNRAVRGERVPDSTIRAIAATYPEQAQAVRDLIPKIQTEQPTGDEVQALTGAAKGLINTNKMMYHKAVARRAEARAEAERAKLGEARIAAPAFSGKILTGPDAKRIAKAVNDSFDPGFSKVLGAVNKFNAVARFFMLAGDISPFMIQLIWMMGYPKQYAQAFAGAVNSILNPDFHAKQLAKHKDVIDRHPNLMITYRGRTEFTEAMAGGGWLSGDIHLVPGGENYWKTLGLLVPRIAGKVGGKVLSPFQRGFEGALDLAGIYLALAYEHTATTPEQIADLDAWINEFRGLISTPRMGVSQRVRQAERAGVLAPQYNRAIAAWMWSFFRGGLRGKYARQSLARGLVALTAMGILISLLRGEDKDEVIEHFNPNSSKFFTWDIEGQKVGPGSKVRSLLKLWAQSIDDPDELLELSMDNPALRFLRGNLSPAVSSAVDIVTGKSYIGDPTRDGLLSFSEEILAGNLLPIWVQSTMLEGGTPGGRTIRGLAEFFGWRAYPEPLWDEVSRLRDKYAQQDFNIEYSELNREQVDQLKVNHPDLLELEQEAELEGVERGSEFEQAFYHLREEAITQRNDALEGAAVLLLNGTISKYEYDNERGYARPYYSGGMSVLYGFRDRLDKDAVEDIEEWLSENQKPEDKALDEYQEYRATIIEKADLPRDWDAIQGKCDQFLSGYPKNIQEYVKRNLNRWINDLPENAKKVEQMRLAGIENETWWDDYRGVTTSSTGGGRWSKYLPSGEATTGGRWSKYLP